MSLITVGPVIFGEYFHIKSKNAINKIVIQTWYSMDIQICFDTIVNILKEGMCML